MRVNQKSGEVEREPLIGIDDARLAKVRGGLKAERIQGSDPAGPGGT